MSGTVGSLKLLGVRVDKVDWPLIDRFCAEALSHSKPQHIVTLNGELILAAQKNPEFTHVINGADLVIPDSTNVLWASHWTKQPLPMLTPGSDLVVRLARLAAETGRSLYLLGGRGGVAEQAAQALKEYYPGLKIAGTSEADPEQEGIAAKIAQSGAAIVLVAYGAPKQELWINRHKEKTGARILVGVGGTFDMLAGKLPRAPRWIQQLHLEWLWRLLLEPKRLKRVWQAVVVFPLKVLFN